jgi:hypothetical protein
MAKPKNTRTPNPTAASQEVKAADDPTRREPQDDPKFHADAPLRDPSGVKGDLPENPDRNVSEPAPGTVTVSASGQSREILLPDGTPAGGDRVIQRPGGPDATGTVREDGSTVMRASAKPLPTEEEALAELEANPERTSVLSEKGMVTRDRLHRVTFDVESRSGIAQANVTTEGGSVKVNKAPV